MPVTRDADAAFPCRVEKKVFFTEIQKGLGGADQECPLLLGLWVRH